MKATPHRELKLDKYLALFDPAVRGSVQLAICDGDGQPVCASDDSGDTRVSAAIESLTAAGFGWEATRGERRRNVDAENVLLYQELRYNAECFGWVALLVPRTIADSKTKEGLLKTGLRTVVSFLEDDYGLQVENELLAGEIAKRHEELNLIYSLGDMNELSFGADHTVKPLLERICLHIDVELVAFVRTGGAPPVYVTAPGVTIPSLDLVLVELRGDLLRFVGADRRAIVLNHNQDPRREFLLPHSPYKFLACPITRSAFDGMLVMMRRADQRDFENGDRNLAHVIAEQLGTLMRNQSMLDDLRRFGEQLAGSLIEAVEAKDPYTRGHSERVQAVAVQLGRLLRLETGDLRDLYWGSIMHDVGKIGIPDVILSKPGRLTEAEYTFIKTHPERSFEILQHVNYATPNMLDGARFHHERYDGAGYPRGLRGKEIPLHARIIAIADTYDAMTSSRSYRAAMTHDDACDEIRRCRGSQFDPEIADAFLKASKKDVDWLTELKTGEPAPGE